MEKSNLIYGKNPVLEALDTDTQFEKVLIQNGIDSELETALRKKCGDKKIPLKYVPKEKIQKLVSGNHQGVVAYVSLVRFTTLKEILKDIIFEVENPIFVIAENITDVRNLGAIARSAEAFGAQALIIPDTGSASINADAMKTSAGALNHLTICRERSLIVAVEDLQEVGVKIITTGLKAQEKIQDIDFDCAVGIVLGAEDRGVSRLMERVADHNVIIPQFGTTDSLNVSVAAGIMLYEATRGK